MSQRLQLLSIAIGLASSGSRGREMEMWRPHSARLLQEHFLAACRELQVKVLLEVGAHGAETSVQFVQGGGDAIAFEANPFTHAEKTILAEAHGVDVRNVAVGRHVGTAEMRIPLSGESLTPGNASFLERETIEEYRTVSVPMITLDEVQKELRVKSNIALWVDVEGLALEVLRGGESMLQDGCDLVFVEVETVKFWKDQSTVGDVDAFMQAAGYIPIMRDDEYFGQYNVLYAREAVADRLDDQVASFWGDLARIRTHTHQWVILAVRRRWSKLIDSTVRPHASPGSANPLSPDGNLEGT